MEINQFESLFRVVELFAYTNLGRQIKTTSVHRPLKAPEVRQVYSNTEMSRN